MRAVALVLVCFATVGGCRCAQDNVPVPAASVSAAPSSSAPPAKAKRTPKPAPKGAATEWTTPDGVTLKGTAWMASQASAPLVVMAHRMAGNRSEWMPLIERVLPAKHPMHLVIFDLRGHGESTAMAKHKEKLGWNVMTPPEFEAMAVDVQTVVEWADHAEAGRPEAVLLVGSDIGATAAVRSAKQVGDRLRGVALISPGAALKGMDLYRPFGLVTKLPNLIVGATGDNTSHDAVLALAGMSKTSTVVQLPGSSHSAEYLGRDNVDAWDAVADWIEARVAPQDAGTKP